MEAVNLTSILIGISFALIGLVYKIMSENIKSHALKLEKHDARIQRVEDVYAIKMEVLIKDMNEFKIGLMSLKDEMTTLKNYVHEKVHADKEILAQQKMLINEIYKKIESMGV